MDVEDKFVSISALLCETTRARMLWNLLDGRAYTAGEMSIVADTSPTSASNHLSKLLEAEIVKVEIQGRHRYYSLLNSDVAYAVEGLANLAKKGSSKIIKKQPKQNGVKYCRTCYDHLAGFVGVKIAETLEAKGYLTKSKNIYLVSKKGWEWFQWFNISKEGFINNRRPITRQCLDWSERRPHLAGQLGASFLNKMFDRKWFKKVEFSRELIITSKGREELYKMLGIAL
ncbi:helix-turn-helix transcriptional regulator [Ginsengibacter hankyongi]|uniref:Helix-turn-helix transcriptional regulator n=1 Tax=Ginsengibacter hankyongi TaxID=2607284 RepID=A0A5J5IHJ6_9BACT|nr:helix-turn-helix transcriptional regulator [Ginsengibacter hankyongi]KAA9037232.1 helix-turn-helix transcriptional regulator [Ginsengibacter hankyongi]